MSGFRVSVGLAALAAGLVLGHGAALAADAAKYLQSIKPGPDYKSIPLLNN